MPARLLPVDCPAIHTRPEVNERIEVGAFAPGQLRNHSLERISVEDSRALVMHRSQIGQHRHGSAKVDRALVPGKAERPGPTQPQPLEPGDSASNHIERQQDRPAAVLEGNADSPFIFGRNQRGVLQRHPGISRAAIDGHCHRTVARFPDIGMAGKNRMRGCRRSSA